MLFVIGNLPRHAARFGAVIAVSVALCGCSMMPDWLGGDSDTTTASDDATTLPPDQSAAGKGQYPDLADTPDRPAAPSTADEQKQVASSLGADRSRQNYSADQLRAGTEAAAAPPPAEAPHEDVAEVDTSSKQGTPSSDTSGASPDSGGSSSSGSGTSGGSSAAPPSPAPTTPFASTPAPAISGASSGQPAVPPLPSGSVVGAQSMSMSDSQLGFQPSKAPPLDPSVSQFVPQPIIARYRQTASLGGAPGVGVAAGGPVVSGTARASAGRGPAVGGPEAMSGAVVANFDALQGGAVAPSSSVSADAAGLPPTATVIFPRDTTILSAEAKEQVWAAAQTFNAQGGAGYIRVVGHSSSRSANMSVSRHLEWDFEHSQARANSVARALIAAGVPANKVLIEAVGDSQPDTDEQTSRRADIFVQS